MDHVVTVGMIVKPALFVIALLVVLGIGAFVLSVIAEGFKH